MFLYLIFSKIKRYKNKYCLSFRCTWKVGCGQGGPTDPSVSSILFAFPELDSASRSPFTSLKLPVQ